MAPIVASCLQYFERKTYHVYGLLFLAMSLFIHAKMEFLGRQE
jgi:hypothetical protein